MTENERPERDANIVSISNECASALTWDFTDDELRRLQPGALIKVVFLIDEDRHITEGIWVRLVEKLDRKWSGVLDNYPLNLDAGLGDTIWFEPGQVVDVDSDTYFDQLK